MSSARELHANAHLRTALRADALLAFEQRLARMYRHWSRWARRQDCGAFRCYDRDIPEFPLAIDCYLPIDRGRSPRLHVQEIETGWVQTAHDHAVWLDDVREAIARATSISSHDIVWKQRPRRSDGVQHEKTGMQGEPFLVCEAGLRFWVNLESYVDTGLFPDHRRLRAIVRAHSSGKRVLNLFGYTGSFTVYAAAGNARSTMTVDLSNTYLAWAARNIAANGIDPQSHALVRADATAWLQEAAREHLEFDIIVCDPPSFSNSSRMHGVLDIQRDHPDLIRACMNLLAPAGELYFSTNLRTFMLDAAQFADAQWKDITRATRAEDFRDPRVHQAFVFRRP